MTNLLSIFIIVCAAGLVQAKALAHRMEHELVFRGLLTSQTPDVVIFEINKDFIAGIGYDLIGSASLSQTFRNMLNLDVSKLALVRPQLRLEDLSDDLFRFFGSFTPTDVIRDQRGFQMNLQDFLNDVVRIDLQRSKWAPTDYHQLLPYEMINCVFARLETEGSWKNKGADDRGAAKEMAKRSIRKSMTLKGDFVNSYKRLRADPQGVIGRFTLQLVKLLVSDNTCAFSAFEKIIMALFDGISGIGAEDALESLGKELQKGFSSSPYLNKDVYRRSGLLAVKAMASLVTEETSEGEWPSLLRVRALFVSFFPSPLFRAPSPAYKAFLQTYMSLKQKSIIKLLSFQNFRFDQSALFLDFVFMQDGSSGWLLSPKMLRLILSRIDKLASQFSKNDLELLSQSRALFDFSDRLLLRNYEIFSSLYDVRLSVAAHWKHREQDKVSSVWRKWAIYLDETHQALAEYPERAQYLSGPDSEIDSQCFYSQSVSGLYFFFKTVLMFAQIAAKETSDLKFTKFECLDDWLVHAFTLEPSVRRLLKQLQNNLRPKAGYNYCVFSDTKVDRMLLLRLEEKERVRREYIERNELNPDD